MDSKDSAVGEAGPGEAWEPIEGFDGYLVSSLGRVLSKRYAQPRILSTARNRDGYVKVRLWRDNRPHYKYMHLLVAVAFVGPRPDGMEARHRDDDKENNSASNLHYGTRSDNILDAVRNGRQANAAKTHCPRGHAYSPENTRVRPTGWRSCRQCQRDRNRKQVAA